MRAARASRLSRPYVTLSSRRSCGWENAEIQPVISQSTAISACLSTTRITRPFSFRQPISQRLYSTQTSTTPPEPKQSTTTEEIIHTVSPVPSGIGRYATITINNPRRLNNLNSDMITQLTSTLSTLSTIPDLRLTVIKGATMSGKTASFSSGANIHEMSHLTTPDTARSFITHLSTLCETLRTHPTITVAQIHGLCFGGALELAACADFRLATRASSFSMPETKYGIPSVIHARVLANIVGWQRAKRLVYLAEVYDAETMGEWGLVDTVCADEEHLEREAAALVARVAGFGVRTMRVQKELVREWEENGFNEGIEAGVDSFARMWEDGGTEPREYMKQFTERKKSAGAQASGQ